MIREFLESSTIHGLVHISTSSSRSLRAIWVAIVVACSAIAIHMITSSYKEWQESPVSTTITTHPITDLQFPAVTVCPPRGSNTVLNQVLEKVKEDDFTEKERKRLINISRGVFIQGPTKIHAKQMSDLLNPENIRSIANIQANMPSVDKDTNVITLTSRESRGSFSTPGFGNSACNTGDFFNRPHALHYDIQFPTNIIGYTSWDGDLVITVQTKDEWSFSWKPNLHYMHHQKLNMTEAENFCVRRGGHLASIKSKEEEKEVKKMMPYGDSTIWLGGKRNSEQKSWIWLDGRNWQFEGEWEEDDDVGETNNCLSLRKEGIFTPVYSWREAQCNETYSFVCRDSPEIATGNKVFIPAKHISSFHVQWNFDPGTVTEHCSGIKIDWRIENGTKDRRELVSNQLSGTVSTPGLGNLLNVSNSNEQHEYTVVINLPSNITDILDNAILEVDIDVTVTQPESRVELWTSYIQWLSIGSFGGKHWRESVLDCMSRGGNIASIQSFAEWQHVQSSLGDLESLKIRTFWLGGKRNEGKWQWSDGSQWSYTQWAPGQPDNKTKDEDCLATTGDGMWEDTSCEANHYAICDLPKLANVKSDTQLIFTARNVTKTALRFTWTAQYRGNITIGGVKLTWKIKHHDASLELAQERDTSSRKGDGEWKLKQNQESKDMTWDLVGLINLAEKLDGDMNREGQAWKALLKFKEELTTGSCGSGCMCTDHIPEVLFELGQELRLNIGFNTLLPDDYSVKLGFQMYVALLYCPDHHDEAKRLSLFFESLLTNQTLGTVLAATFNNLETGLDSDIMDYTTMHMWHNYLYKKLDARYNFSLGASVIALSTTEQLVELAKLDPPYLREYGQLEEAASEKLDLSGKNLSQNNVLICKSICSVTPHKKMLAEINNINNKYFHTPCPAISIAH